MQERMQNQMLLMELRMTGALGPQIGGIGIAGPSRHGGHVAGNHDIGHDNGHFYDHNIDYMDDPYVYDSRDFYID